MTDPDALSGLRDGATRDADVEAGSALAEVLAALAALSEQQQEIVRLRFQMDLSYRQISAITGLSVSNVGYHIHTALARVRATALAGPQSEYGR